MRLTPQELLKDIEAVSHLPVERLSQKAFDALLEYSCTDPTGVFPGKVWKRNLTAYAPRDLMDLAAEPVWVICEYVTSKPGRCCVEFRRPEIVDLPTRR